MWARRIAGFFIILLCLMSPVSVWAHASLEEAVPAPGSQLSAAPSSVVLTFNEGIENQVYSLQVFDQDGKPVTDRKAAVSENRRQLSLDLPKLDTGWYTVSYKVISADGHPISGSYVVTVGSAASGASAETAAHSHEHDLSSDMEPLHWAIFAARMVYFIVLLLLAGWVLWSVISPARPEHIRDTDAAWSFHLQGAFLLAQIVLIALQMQLLIDGWEAEQLIGLFFGTTVGLSWVSSLCLGFIGLAVLHRWRWADGVWVLLLLAAKSVNGHAMAYDPPLRTVALDLIHLLAAAVWAGGLFYLAVHWRKHREHALQFYPLFSRAAFGSIAVLTVTGTISALLYSRKLQYLLETQWGLLLFIKCALVALVIAAAGWMRLLVKRGKLQGAAALLKLDVALMLLISCVVGIFTYLSPTPANTPLYWHEMGTTIHMSANITPNVPGNNNIRVKVWLPEKQGKPPKTVQLYMTSLDRPEVAPIEVPLAPLEGAIGFAEFPDFKDYQYSSQGPYLPFAGNWEVQVRVMDPEDNETVYRKEIRIY
ncbi:copper resistance CopC/CopD family protein [Paenibacillus sp. y28]|uniref:copper resistance CopC/CopD family protein n=1 Tax=Paenibacillus sp. y28 TaxID=3129110 RepID=UPI003015CC40